MVLPLNAAYGYLWWLNHRGVLAGALIPMSLQQAASPATPKTRLVPGAPDQVYWAIGLGNQIVQANFSLWADVPLWRVYTLVATSFTGGGVRGIMYDASDSHQRQGMAVFYDAIQGTDAASQRAQLRTYVHELGHCFNLLHSWQKNLANPPQPLGPNGGLGDLSWMNYTWKYQPSPPAPGGDAAY